MPRGREPVDIHVRLCTRSASCSFRLHVALLVRARRASRGETADAAKSGIATERKKENGEPKERKKENRQPKGGMGGRHAATTHTGILRRGV